MGRDGHKLSAGQGRLPIKIHLAGYLKNYTKENVEIDLPEARDVLDVVMKLDERFPRVRDRILDEHGSTRPYVNIFVNEENARDLRGGQTSVKDGDVIYILPSVAGGWQ